MLQRYFLGYRTTRSLGNKLPGDEIQEADLCANDYRCGSISRYGQSPNQESGSGYLRCLRSWSMTASTKMKNILENNIRVSIGYSSSK